MKKGTKIHNRVRKVREDTLFKLYNKLPLECQSCVFNANCSEIEKRTDVSDNCINYKMAIELNTLIEMMKNQNIDIEAFCEKYKVKKEFFMGMIKGKMLFNYRYYCQLAKRLHVEEFDEFFIYNKRFDIDENETDNNTSDGGIK